jgi:hypothetical protein
MEKNNHKWKHLLRQSMKTIRFILLSAFQRPTFFYIQGSWEPVSYLETNSADWLTISSVTSGSMFPTSSKVSTGITVQTGLCNKWAGPINQVLVVKL